MFTSSFLDGVRRRAFRGRFWFRALDGLERGILILSARVLDGVVDARDRKIEYGDYDYSN